MQKRPDERNKGVIFKTFAPFTYCISEINNNQISSAKDLDAVMPMYNFIEYSDNSKSIERLWQYYKISKPFIQKLFKLSRSFGCLILDDVYGVPFRQKINHFFEHKSFYCRWFIVKKAEIF